MIEWGLCKGQSSHNKSSLSVIFAALLHKATIRINNPNLIEVEDSSLEVFVLVSEYNQPLGDKWSEPLRRL